MAGLYSIIEGATGHRDALIWPSLGKSREAFTAMLVAANAYYLSLATASAEEARRNTETIEKTIPVMSDLAENDLQRMALQRLQRADRGAARRPRETVRAASPTAPSCCATPSTPARPTPSAPSTNLSVKMRQREQKAQDDVRPHAAPAFPRRVLSIAVIFLGIIITAGVIIALVDPPAAAADHGGDARHHVRRLRPPRAGHRAPRTRSARWRARSRCSAKTPSPSARPKTSCAPPRKRPRARCSN